MLRAIVALSVAAMPLALAAVPPTLAAAPCGNPLPHEPLVVYDINGGTLAGPIYENLTVYNDGFAQIHLVGTAFGPARAEVAFVGAAAAHQLILDLAVAGAGTLCDDTSTVNDVPMQTLTVLRDATDTRGHTYSWWVAAGPYAPVEQRITAFIQTAFPNF